MRRKRTILHVDDDQHVLDLVSAKLSGLGFEVTSLKDPTKTLSTLSKTEAKLVLLDIDMSPVDGLTLLKEIKQENGGTQVIMLTGLVTMGTALQSMRWGAEACVFKPIDDFQTLLTPVNATFDKIDRWWNSLDDLVKRKKAN